MNGNPQENQQWYPNHPALNNYPASNSMNDFPPFIQGNAQGNPEWLRNNLLQSAASTSTQQSTTGPAPTIINHYHIFYGAPPFPGAYGQSWCETQQVDGVNYWRSPQAPAWQPVPTEAMFHGPPVPPQQLPLASPLASSECNPSAGHDENTTTRQITIKKERNTSEEDCSLQNKLKLFSAKQITIKKEPCSDFFKENETCLKQRSTTKKRCSDDAKEEGTFPIKQCIIKQEPTFTVDKSPPIQFSTPDLWSEVAEGIETLSSLDDGASIKKETSLLAPRKSLTKLKPSLKRSIQKSVLKVAPRITQAPLATTVSAGKERVLEALQKCRSEYGSCKIPYQKFMNAYKKLHNVEFTQEERSKYFGINNAKPIFTKYCKDQVKPHFVGDDQFLICNDNCTVHLYNRTDLIEIAAKVLNYLVKTYPQKFTLEHITCAIRKSCGLDFERYNITGQCFIYEYLNGRVFFNSNQELLLTSQEISFRGLGPPNPRNLSDKNRYQKVSNNFTTGRGGGWVAPKKSTENTHDIKRI